MMIKTKYMGLIALALLSAACTQKPEAPSTELVQASKDSSVVLATVNGEPITQDDVEFMINRTFSGSEKMFFDDAMQDKVLDSLIASKAMQQTMLATLSVDELTDIKNRARAYEEELYLKAYLQQNATPEPVSQNMVQDYYAQYPEEFGGGESRLFEMLATSTKPNETDRDQILAATELLKGTTDWVGYAQTNQLGLTYKKASLSAQLFDPSLERAVRVLAAGETSDVILIKGSPHIVRVLEIKQLPAKPISQVSGQIRKKLAALQLKKAVKSASEEAVSKAKVIRK